MMTAMYQEDDDRQERRIAEARVRARAETTRRALLDLLREGPMSSDDLRARLAGDASISVVNYHLGVLLDSKEILSEDGIYRLA